MSRTETYTYTLLDRAERLIGPLDGVSDGRLNTSIYEAIRSGGMITYHGTPLDWDQYRIKITYTMRDGDQTLSWPMGVYLPAAPQQQHDDGQIVTPLALYDKLLILHEDAYMQTVVVPAGADPAQRVAQLIIEAGETNVVITPSGQTLRNDLIFEPGTTRLQVANAILEAANYTSLWCDGNGQFRAEPYEPPSARPLVHDFRSGANSLHVARLTVNRDTFSKPNRLTLISRTDGDTPALVSTRTLDQLAPNHALAYAQRGRWVSQVEQDVEATSQEVLDDLCERRLLAAANLAATADISHAMLPLELNDRVRLSDDSSGVQVELMATITKQALTLTPGSLVSSTLRQVNS